MVDAAAPAQKRAREEPIPVPAAASAEVSTSTTEEPAAKKSKKDKKAAKAAAKAAEASAAAKSEPAASKEEKTAEPTPKGTLSSFLATLLPDLLTSSKSLSNLRSEVVEKAKTAGWKDEAAVIKAFEEGLWLGGDKPKRMLQLKYEA